MFDYVDVGGVNSRLVGVVCVFRRSENWNDLERIAVDVAIYVLLMMTLIISCPDVIFFLSVNEDLG